MLVKVSESVQCRFEQLSDLGGRKRSLRNDLSKGFFRVLHHHKKQITIAQPAASFLQERN
jgi:hypothetical protein